MISQYGGRFAPVALAVAMAHETNLVGVATIAPASLCCEWAVLPV
jgi:hypothetical protein